jgi:hypothetical protein
MLDAACLSAGQHHRFINEFFISFAATKRNKERKVTAV